MNRAYAQNEGTKFEITASFFPAALACRWQRVSIGRLAGTWLTALTMLENPSSTHTNAVGAGSSLVWWVIPGALAGMPMPFIHPERRLNMGGALTAYDDGLPAMYAAGIRAVVCLLDRPSDASVYESAGVAFKCLPVPDGRAPTMDQAKEFVRFVDRRLAERQPVAVHCEGGIGRTGTMLAAYLISQGESAESAICRVRAVRKAAVETKGQVRFLEQFAATRRHSFTGLQ